MKSSKEALATHLGMDMSDLSDYNYQPGRFTRAVYAVDDNYYCAVKTFNDLPKPTRKSVEPLHWREEPDPYVNKYGYHVFKA